MDLATVDQLLTATRSVRARLDLTRPVDRQVIEECLEIAVQAPTVSNLRRYHFVVVTASQRGERARTEDRGVSGTLGHVTNGPVRGGMVSAQSTIQTSAARWRRVSEVAAYD